MSGTASEVDLLSWSFAQDPHSRYVRMRRDGVVRKHVVKTLAIELNAWVVTGYEDARALLADPRLAKDVEVLLRIMSEQAVNPGEKVAQTPRSMLFSDPPDHTRLRRILGNAFTMRRVEKLRPWIEETVDSLLDSVRPGEEFDLVQKIAMALPIYVIGQLLGIPQSRHDDFRKWNSVLASLETSAEEKREAHGMAFGYLRELIADKRREPGDDMVSALIGATYDGSALDEPELLSTTFLLMNAGYETTAHMISSGVLALLANPGQQGLLRRDPTLVPGAIEEFLRFESPLNMSTLRYTASPVRVGEVTIPKSELVFISLLSANRDAAKFDNPDAFDVTRPNKAHVSFGHGIHHCIGAPLARMEGDIVFRKLLERFPVWELAVPEDEIEWKYSAQFRGIDRLPVRMS
ncbi:cytochrome P450 [Streptomyces sp. NPDC059788]|uniref:cytochrome P450 family protein n=1 Tax=Streptomyces sp. NPDC059788 TaxID=3346948 RepID=UPI00365652DB